MFTIFVPSPNGSLVIAIKLKDKGNFRRPIVTLHLINKVPLKKFSIFSKIYVISFPGHSLSAEPN
jgi:hypothetical protein